LQKLPGAAKNRAWTLTRNSTGSSRTSSESDAGSLAWGCRRRRCRRPRGALRGRGGGWGEGVIGAAVGGDVSALTGAGGVRPAVHRRPSVIRSPAAAVPRRPVEAERQARSSIR